MRLLPRLVPAVAAVLFSWGPLAAQEAQPAMITVVDSATREPLHGAQVVVTRGTADVLRATTDSTGVLRIPRMDPGRYEIRAQRLGYTSVVGGFVLQGGRPAAMVLALSPSTLALDAVSVQAELRWTSRGVQDFYRRANSGSTGHYVRREDITNANMLRFTDVFRGIPGLQLSRLANGGTAVRMIRNLASTADGDCPPLYYVDGILFPGVEQLNADSFFSIHEIEGVEVYNGIAPAQFGGSRARCGVVVIWTRDR